MMSYGDVQISGKVVGMLALVIIVATVTFLVCFYIDQAIRSLPFL